MHWQQHEDSIFTSEKNGISKKDPEKRATAYEKAYENEHENVNLTIHTLNSSVIPFVYSSCHTSIGLVECIILPFSSTP